MELTRHYIERLVFDGGTIVVTDPGSGGGNPYSLTPKIAPGSYGCYIYTDDAGAAWVCQIASTEPAHCEFVEANIHNEQAWEEVGVVGVASGYAGFFDKKPKLSPAQWGKLLAWMEEDPDDIAFIHDFSDEGNPIPNGGFWSIAGDGNDLYCVYALKQNEEIVALEIRFNETVDFSNGGVR